MNSTCLKVISMWRQFFFQSQKQDMTCSSQTTVRKDVHTHFLYICIHTSIIYVFWAARKAWNMSFPLPGLLLTHLGLSGFSFLLWLEGFSWFWSDWVIAGWTAKTTIPIYLDKQDLKALLLMVEGTIYPIGMPIFQFPPSGQNIPADGQMLCADIFNI